MLCRIVTVTDVDCITIGYNANLQEGLLSEESVPVHVGHIAERDELEHGLRHRVAIALHVGDAVLQLGRDHPHALLKNVQQSHFESRFAFWHFDLQIGAQMRTAIPYSKPILKTLKLMIEVQIEMKYYVFLSVQQLRLIATLKHKLR